MLLCIWGTLHLAFLILELDSNYFSANHENVNTKNSYLQEVHPILYIKLLICVCYSYSSAYVVPFLPFLNNYICIVKCFYQSLYVSNSYKWFLTIFNRLCFCYFSFFIKNLYVIFKATPAESFQEIVSFTNQLVKRKCKKSCLPKYFQKSLDLQTRKLKSVACTMHLKT